MITSEQENLEKAGKKIQHSFMIFKKKSQQIRSRKEFPQVDKKHLTKT